MLIRLIISPADENRSGANQMRQHLSFREHFRRGNAASYPDCRATIGYHTLPASEEALLGGVNDSLLLLMVFAAAVRSVVQPTPPASGLKAAA
jgi:hypothetical protein